MLSLCDCDFGLVTSSSCYACMEFHLVGLFASVHLAFCFLQGFVYWTVSVSHSVHKPSVSCTCKEKAFNGDRCVPKVSDPSVYSYKTEKVYKWSSPVLNTCMKSSSISPLPHFISTPFIDWPGCIIYTKEMLVNNLTWCFKTLSTVQ